MKKVVVQYDTHVHIYNNVTKVQCFCSLDFFKSHIDIFEADKKTTIKMCEINGFEVIDLN